MLATDLGIEFPIVGEALVIIVLLDILLGFFNLIPVSPLDGWKILLLACSARDRLAAAAVPRAVRDLHPDRGHSSVSATPYGCQTAPIIDGVYGLLVG